LNFLIAISQFLFSLNLFLNSLYLVKDIDIFSGRKRYDSLFSIRLFAGKSSGSHKGRLGFTSYLRSPYLSDLNIKPALE